jgi:small subunit ribosomal protein S20
MNKKQRNRKVVAQNRRNRIINRRYSSTIRSLSKLFINKVKEANSTEQENNELVKTEVNTVMNKLYSIIDKAVKKGVVHKNTAARKKSKIAILSRQI